MRTILRFAVSLSLVCFTLSAAWAAMPPEQVKAEVAEYKAFFAGVGDARFNEQLTMVEQFVDSQPELAAKMWEAQKPLIDKARKQYSGAGAPEPGVFEFSTSEGGAPATSFTLDKPIYGRLVMKAPIKKFNQAFTIPPGGNDYDHGVAYVEVKMNGEELFLGQTELWDKSYEEALELPMVVLPADDSKLPVATFDPNRNQTLLWRDKAHRGTIAEALLGLMYHSAKPGTYKFEVKLYAGEAYGKRPPIAEGAFDIEVTEAGKAALRKRSKRKVSKAAGGQYAAVDKKALALLKKSQSFKEAKAKAIFARMQSKWKETRHWRTDRLMKKEIVGDIAYKLPDGSCQMSTGINFCQESPNEEGGNLGKLMICDQILAGELGDSTFAFPCEHVK